LRLGLRSSFTAELDRLPLFPDDDGDDDDDDSRNKQLLNDENHHNIKTDDHR